ncbi:MAG TPA: DUF6232 family protein [Anaerolineales bacterium]
MNEMTILQEGLVRITNRRTLIGTQTYSMSDIKSVTIARRAKNTRPIWLLLLGVLLLLWSIIDQTGYYQEFFNWGIALSVLGLTLVVLAKPSYVIRIRSNAGLRDILGSTDRSYIERIVAAMNQGIAGSGEAASVGSQPSAKKASPG